MRPTLRDIETAVCQRFKLTPDQIHSMSRKRCYARPRQIAMFLAREMTDNSLPFIGRYFQRDHSTVLHAERRINYLMERRPMIADYVAECRALVEPTTLTGFRASIVAFPLVVGAR